MGSEMCIRDRCSADVSLDVFTERRVIPDNISLSVASRTCGLLVFVVGQCLRIAAGFQSWVVDWFGLVECVFVGGGIRNSSVDGCWYLFYDVGRVVGLCVDVTVDGRLAFCKDSRYRLYGRR